MKALKISHFKWLGLGVLLLILSSCTGASTLPASTPTPVVPPVCPAPLDSETLSQLRIDPGPTFDLQPGGSIQMTVGVRQCCYIFEPKQACVVWSITGDQGVHIDPLSGQVKVDSTTASGSNFVINANVENGKRLLTSTLNVYTPGANPLVGTWREDAEFECGTHKEIKPPEAISELIFKADNSFLVTWHPFEVYHDYWGKYQFDLTSGKIDLTLDGGNYVPTDFDGNGTFSIDPQGRLIFTDVWLGQPHSGKVTPACGHRFIH